MKLLLEDLEMDSQLQRTATAVYSGSADLGEVLAMGAAGTVHCEMTTRPLDQVAEVLEQLRRGEISGRVVLRLSG